MKDEVEKLTAKYITRESHKGSVNRIRHLLAEDISALQVEAVRAELEGLFRDDRSYVDFVDVTVIEDRLASLKEDGETK